MRALAVSGLLGFASVACGGTTSEPPPTDDPVVPGSDCSPLDAQAPAVDGCNVCTCSPTGWVCGEMACPPPGDECTDGEVRDADDGCNTCECQAGAWVCTRLACQSACEDGTVKAAGDGCNTCACEGGAWACTEEGCPEPECPIPDDLPDQTCEGVELFGRAHGTDACCELCYSLPGYTYYESMEVCEASKVCSEGETKYADDYCNTCTCTSDGTWACTEADCEAVWCGGLGGSTCAEDEYCAYEADTGGCGAGDANTICRPRPSACDTYEAPVCGCDGETYSNACVAAMAGVGLMMEGPCEAPPPE